MNKEKVLCYWLYFFSVVIDGIYKNQVHEGDHGFYATDETEAIKEAKRFMSKTRKENPDSRFIPLYVEKIFEKKLPGTGYYLHKETIYGWRNALLQALNATTKKLSNDKKLALVRNIISK